MIINITKVPSGLQLGFSSFICNYIFKRSAKSGDR